MLNRNTPPGTNAPQIPRGGAQAIRKNSGSGTKPKLDIRRLLPYLRPYRARFILGLGFLSIASGMALCFPLLVGGLIDAALHPGGTILPGIGHVALNGVVLYLVGTVLLQSLATFAANLSFRFVGQSALAVLRRITYERILLLPMSFFGQRRTGELVSRMSSDINQIEGALVNGLPQICRQIVVFLGTIAFIAVTSSQLTLILLLTLPLPIAALTIFRRKIRKLSREVQDRLADCGVIVEECIQAIASVKAFANENFEVNRYERANTAVLRTGFRSAFWNASFSGFTVCALFIGIIFVLWRGAVLLQTGELSAGELTRFILYATFLAGAMGQMAELYALVQRGLGATERVQELLREKTEAMLQTPTGSSDNDVPSRLTGDVEFSNVTFAYLSRPEAVVLSNISFVVSPGQSLALVGPSGAGKSTITSLLLRFYDPTAGFVKIGGRDIRDYPLSWLRGQVAIVPQDVVLFGGSIADNIAYGRLDASPAEIREAARQANADEFIGKFPDGYETTVGDRGVKLSGGQRQRIAIARAFLKNPSILILDEATSSLDSESELLIQRGLESLMRGRTTFIVAHRLATIRKVDRIAVLESGKLVEFGTHETLLDRDEGLYRRLSELQRHAYPPGPGV